MSAEYGETLDDVLAFELDKQSARLVARGHERQCAGDQRDQQQDVDAGHGLTTPGAPSGQFEGS